MNKYTISRMVSVPAAVLLFALASTGIASALTTITSSLDFGATGGNVTSLQQFLATDVSVYPEALVTGYYGPLTRAAVQRYQCKQGIVCGGTAASTGYGRVGPRTLAAINASIRGGTTTTGDSSAPIMSTVLTSMASSSVTFTWTTNEPARGAVYYSPSPLTIMETLVGSAVVGGQSVSESSFGFNHALTISGLTANTLYYFAAKSDDASGNIQFAWPSVVRTAQ